MPIIGKSTNLQLIDLNNLLGVANTTQVSFSSATNTLWGTTPSDVSFNSFRDTLTGTQSGSVVQPVLSTTDPTDWIHRAEYVGGGPARAISGDGNTLAIAKDGVGVWVYDRSGTTWVLNTIITSQTRYHSLALNYNGTTMGIGDGYHTNTVNPNPPDYPGKVAIYIKSGGNWSFQANVVPTGYSIALYYSSGPNVGLNQDSLAFSDDGNTLAAGGANDNGTRGSPYYGTEGAIYVFVRSGSTWSQQARLTSAARYTGITASYSGGLGGTVGISSNGNTIVSGQPQDALLGSMLVFTRSGTTWSTQAAIANDGSSICANYFGYQSAVSPDGNTFVATGYNSGNDTFIAYTRSGSTWTKQATVQPPGNLLQSFFNIKLTNSGNTLLVPHSNYFGFYIYTRSGSTWSLSQNVTSSNCAYLSTSAVNSFVVNGGSNPAISGANTFTFVTSSYTKSGETLFIKPPSGIGASGVGQRAIKATDSGDVYLTENGYRPSSSVSKLANNSTVIDTDTLIISSSTKNLQGEVSLNGDQTILVAGAPNSRNVTGILVGSCEIFSNTGGNWVSQTTLQPTDLVSSNSENAQFGTAARLSSDGTVLVVSAPGEKIGANSVSGSVYIYTRSGSTWTQRQKITNPSALAYAYFGSSADISSNGHTIVIGASNENSYVGSVRIYTTSNFTSWSLQQTITGFKTGTSTGISYFGDALSLSSDGNLLAIGAYGDSFTATTTQTGSVHIYTRTGSTWTKKSTLQVATTLGMGKGVSLSGDGTILVTGASLETSNGAAFVFRKTSSDATSWTQSYQLEPTDGFIKSTTAGVGSGTINGCGVSINKIGNKIVLGSSTGEGLWIYK